jgi:hypothetical protein
MQYVREIVLDDHPPGDGDDDADLEELERTLLEEGHLTPKDLGTGAGAGGSRQSHEAWERTFDFDEEEEEEEEVRYARPNRSYFPQFANGCFVMRLSIHQFQTGRIVFR